MGPHPIVLLRLGFDNYLQKIFSTISIISVLTSCCSAEISLIEAIHCEWRSSFILDVRHVGSPFYVGMIRI